MLNRIISLFLLLIILACSNDDDPVQKSGPSISGVVTEKGVGVSGVSLTANGQAGTTTDAAGKFSIQQKDAGSYVIKPEQQGRSFLPPEISVNLSTTNIEDINFERAANDQVIHNEAMWDLFQPSVYSIKQNSDNTLQLDLEENALWYNNSQGGLIHRAVTGDFTITATVNAVRKSNNDQPVACDICLGGLMIRNPSNNSRENYVHLVTGFTPDGLGVEFKSTTNGSSQFDTAPDGTSLHDLRIQRSGNTFTLSQKLPEETDWTVVATYNRPDLPATLMAGINIYTAQSGTVADLSIIYENIAIE